jgi:hypothetical protein
MTFLPMLTAASMLLAAIMSVIAWRIAGDERRRSAARIAALAVEIHGAGYAAAPVAVRRPASGSHPFAIVGGGALVVGAAIALAIVTGYADRAPRAAATPATAPAATAAPLELVALGDERVGDQLTVRGVVRNPAAAAAMDGVIAVVQLIASDGGVVATARAAVVTTTLIPGRQSTFVVTVPRAADVARYRVSFTTDDRVVPHLDRRHES